MECQNTAAGVVTTHQVDVDLTHWDRVCVGNLTTIGSDNGLSHGRRQAIFWTNAAISFVNWTLRINFSEMLIEIQTFSFKQMHLKMSSAKWRPFYLALNVLIPLYFTQLITLCYRRPTMITQKKVLGNFSVVTSNLYFRVLWKENGLFP